jgi:hypothetical protein
MHNVCTHQPEPQKLTDSTDACLPISIYYSRRRTTSFRSVYISFLRSRVVEVDPRARSEKATTSTLYVQVSQYRTLACIYTYAYGRCDGSTLAERAESRGIATRSGRWSVVMVLARSYGYTTTGYSTSRGREMGGPLPCRLPHINASPTGLVCQTRSARAYAG